MHLSSMKLMEEFTVKYLPNKGLKVLDIGAYDVNGNYKHLFAGHHYHGLDITAGPNVDIVAPNPYEYPIAADTYDVVISGQTVEHVQDMHAWIREITRVVKPGGLICIIGPQLWEEHRYPVDCWRILPDGMRFLLGTIAGLTVIESYMVGRDTIGIATKELPWPV